MIAQTNPPSLLELADFIFQNAIIHRMDILAILTSKPVLIGLHLGSAIIGIDAFLWLLGEVIYNIGSVKRRIIAAGIGLLGYLGAWLSVDTITLNFTGR